MILLFTIILFLLAGLAYIYGCDECHTINNSRAWWWESTPPGMNTSDYCVVDSYGYAIDGYFSVDSGGVSP
jgi:hypothetical protein